MYWGCLSEPGQDLVLKTTLRSRFLRSRRRARRKSCGREGQPESAQLALTEPEEFEYQGTLHYLEAVAARIGVPFLEKLSVTVTNKVDETADLDRNSFKFFARLVGESGVSVLQGEEQGRVLDRDGSRRAVGPSIFLESVQERRHDDAIMLQTHK